MGGTLPLGFSAAGGVGVAVGFWRWSELLHLWQVSAGEAKEHLGLLGVGCSLRPGFSASCFLERHLPETWEYMRGYPDPGGRLRMGWMGGNKAPSEHSPASLSEATEP